MTVHLQILKPIWNGRNGNEKVGIATKRLVDDLLVEILYETSGTRSFPGYYYMTLDTIRRRKYPNQTVKGTELVIIPIKDFEFYREEIVDLKYKNIEKRVAKTEEELKDLRSLGKRHLQGILAGMK